MAKNARLLPAGMKFAFLPQDEQISETMGMGWGLLADPPLAPFEIEVRYEDVAGHSYAERFKIDVGQFNGLSRLGNPPEEEIAENLKKIARVMELWSHQRLQVETMSVAERREHDERVRKMMEQRRAEHNDLANDK